MWAELVTIIPSDFMFYILLYIYIISFIPCCFICSILNSFASIVLFFSCREIRYFSHSFCFLFGEWLNNCYCFLYFAHSMYETFTFTWNISISCYNFVKKFKKHITYTLHSSWISTWHLIRYFSSFIVFITSLCVSVCVCVLLQRVKDLIKNISLRAEVCVQLVSVFFMYNLYFVLSLQHWWMIISEHKLLCFIRMSLWVRQTLKFKKEFQFWFTGACWSGLKKKGITTSCMGQTGLCCIWMQISREKSRQKKTMIEREDRIILLIHSNEFFMLFSFSRLQILIWI